MQAVKGDCQMIQLEKPENEKPEDKPVTDGENVIRLG